MIVNMRHVMSRFKLVSVTPAPATDATTDAGGGVRVGPAGAYAKKAICGVLCKEPLHRAQLVT
jgi:hypothetical protein